MCVLEMCVCVCAHVHVPVCVCVCVWSATGSQSCQFPLSAPTNRWLASNKCQRALQSSWRHTGPGKMLSSRTITWYSQHHTDLSLVFPFLFTRSSSEFTVSHRPTSRFSCPVHSLRVRRCPVNSQYHTDLPLVFPVLFTRSMSDGVQ